MAKISLQVNSQKFLGTHFHIANELERFLKNSGTNRNSSHAFITLTTPLLFAVIAMNDSILRFTLNEVLIETLRKITEYYKSTALLLDDVYSKCNEEVKGQNLNYFKAEAEKIYKKTVLDLKNAAATNLIERLHIKHLAIVLTSVRKITLLKMQFDDCDSLTPLLCDLDLTTKMFLKQMEKMMKV